MTEVSQELITNDFRSLYIYFGLAAIIALYLVFKSKSEYKFELYFLAFYLLTGNINLMLTFRIPGISFFEIQPERFLLLIFLFLLTRRLVLVGLKKSTDATWSMPWFMIVLYLFVICVVVAQFTHLDELGFAEVVATWLQALILVVFVHTLSKISSKEAYSIIGGAIIIGAIFSSVISLIQMGVDTSFMRYGGSRIAFGDTYRANGLFTNEYFNSYFLIIAVIWTLVTVDQKKYKYLLVCLFCAGVFASFQRMSWIALFVVMAIYFIRIEKVDLSRALFIGLCALGIIVGSLFFTKDISESSMVKGRLADSSGGRLEYYGLVLNNIGDKPFFGYGGMENDVYYYNILRITRDLDRASGRTGDLHSGYFTAMFYFGIPAFLCFTSFILLAIFYFARLTKYHLFFVIPYLVSLVYALGNLTNNFLFYSKPLALLFAIHLGLGMGARHLPEYFPYLSSGPSRN